MSDQEGELPSWYAALAEDPDYYEKTKEGQKELAEMIRKESERVIEELGKSVKRTKEIIWLSRFCKDCRYFQLESGRMHCKRWTVRIVKPFYGRPVWGKVASRTRRDEKEMAVEGIDWNQKWREISDAIVDRAVDSVNGGYPYHCFTSK